MRKSICLNKTWGFHYGDIDCVAIPEYTDSQWQQIDLPHTWNNYDGQDGGGDFQRGDAWYHKSFLIDKDLSDKQLYLQFNGVCLVTDVYLNGKHLGQHRGAFATFRFDITMHALFGSENILAVKVNNGRNPEVAPYQTDNMDMWVDFTLFGGIYRDVSLLVTDKLQIDPMFYGSSGVFVRQNHVCECSADVEVTVKIQNHRRESSEAVLAIKILDADSNVVASSDDSCVLATNDNFDIIRSICFENPRLWNASKDPYMYKVVAELRENGVVIDCIEQPLGLRYFHVDANEGFFLNGSFYDLYGVSRHQCRKDKGWAISENDHREDFEIIRELGSTMIRLAHYQHDQLFYDLCDCSGMVVWAEVCLVGHYVDNSAFGDNIIEQLKELIYQNINHPSIICWGLLNEIGEKETEKIIPQLYQTAKLTDPGRLVTLAMHGGEEKDWSGYSEIEGHNKYFGWYKYTWYEDATGEFAEWADKRHKDFPNSRIGITEYGAGANVFQHEDNPVQPEADGQWHPEEYQSYYHELTWKAMKVRPFLWCKVIWNAFDFASDPRNEGEQPGINDKGLVTFDRKIKKDAFYFYKANWSHDPFVYITSRRFIGRTVDVTDVKVYSNCDTVDLILNGKSLGLRNGEDGIFLWRGVRLSDGVNKLKAVSGSCQDTCEWMLS